MIGGTKRFTFEIYAKRINYNNIIINLQVILLGVILVKIWHFFLSVYFKISMTVFFHMGTYSSIIKSWCMCELVLTLQNLW